MLDRRSIPELVRWSTEDCEEGGAEDWLVIENKATTVGQAALHPLSRYVDLLPARVSAQPEQVHGLLLADGASVDLRRGPVRPDGPCHRASGPLSAGRQTGRRTGMSVQVSAARGDCPSFPGGSCSRTGIGPAGSGR